MSDPADQPSSDAPDANPDNGQALIQGEHSDRSQPGKPAMTLLNLGPTKRPTPVAEVLSADAGNVEATNVSMERSGAENIKAERLTMSYSGAKSIDARSAQLESSGVVSLQADHAVLHNSAAISVTARDVRLVKGRTVLLRADSATIDEGARVLIYAGPSSAMMRPTLDAAGAAAAGAGVGLVFLLIGAMMRRLFR